MSTVVRSKRRYTLFSNRALAVLIIPIVIESAFTMSLGLADSFMVQSVGENGTAMSAVSNVDQISNDTIGSIAGNGINTSVLTVVGQAVGTGDEDCVKYYIKKMFSISLVGNALCVGLVWALSPLLVGIFSQNITAEAAAMATGCITLCFSVQIFTYPFSFGGSAVLEATSDVRYTMICAVSSMAVMRVGLSFILCTPLIPSLHIGAYGLWTGMAADWCVRSVLFVWRILSGKWKKASGMFQTAAARPPESK